MATAEEIAQSMIDEIRANGRVRTYQSRVVARIRAEFGEEWSYVNKNGNWAIDKRVIKAFGPLKDEYVVWESSSQCWHVVTPEELERIRKQKADRSARKAEEKKRRAEWEASREGGS